MRDNTIHFVINKFSNFCKSWLILHRSEASFADCCWCKCKLRVGAEWFGHHLWQSSMKYCYQLKAASIPANWPLYCFHDYSTGGLAENPFQLLETMHSITSYLSLADLLIWPASIMWFWVQLALIALFIFRPIIDLPQFLDVVFLLCESWIPLFFYPQHLIDLQQYYSCSK